MDAGHPYIPNEESAEMGDFMSTELEDNERKEIFEYIKSKYPTIVDYFEGHEWTK